MINVFQMNAQLNNEICATANPTVSDPAGVYSKSNDANYLNSLIGEPIVFNIFFWGIKHPDGNDYNPNRANDVLTAVANLNIVYNQFNIFFKYKGYEEIQSPALPNDPNGYYVMEGPGQFGALTAWATANGHKKADSFNVYAYGWGEGFGGISPGYSVTTLGISSGNLIRSAMTHEIAHNFNLKHTRSYVGVNGEQVTRDPNNGHYNADTKGDEVIDTQANIGFRGDGSYPFITSNCEYLNDGSQVDYYGFAYYAGEVDVKNVVSDAYICGDATPLVSIGQGIRIREAIIADVNGQFAPRKTTISSLYEPYAGEYYTPNGTNVNPKALFQPGFDYRFYECDCSCNVPSDYSDTSFTLTQNIIKSVSKFETNYSTIFHPNHTAIGIKFVAQTPAWQIPRRCYDNTQRPGIAGSVMKFNDGIFNSNVTVTPKDSTSINDPNLILDLEPGLYKIQTQYEEGNTEDNVIYKQD